jgi:hypothetical protein
MQVPPPHQYPPPPPGGSRFLQFGVGGAAVIILISVLGTCARIHNRRHDATVEAKKATLPAVGSQGTLAKGGPKASLCPAPKNAFFFGWPCYSEAKPVPAESKVRVMKAGMNGTDAVCRYWVQSGPLDNEAGDAPCEWFVGQ